MSMTSGTMGVGVLAIFSGLLGAYGIQHFFAKEVEKPKALATLIVPKATADLPAGRIITMGDIALHQMTIEQMARENLNNPAVMLSPEQIIGRAVRSEIKEGEAFQTNNLFLEGTGANISQTLKPGFRAVSIEVSRLRGGGLASGTLVDVIFRATAREADDGKLAIPEKTVTLFEGVEIVATELPKKKVETSNTLDLRRMNGRNVVPDPLPIVTLSVTLEQANILRTVEGRGEVSLVARSQGESFVSAGRSRGEALTLEELLGVEPPAQPFSTEQVRGGSRAVQSFGDPHPANNGGKKSVRRRAS